MNRACSPTPAVPGALRRPGAWILLAIVLALGACASPRHRAPVEDRTAAARPPAAAASAPAPAASAALPAPPLAAPVPVEPTDASGRPLNYTVKPGDTLIRIGLETGQNWRDLLRWNGLENPNVIEVGQVLRVAPPGVEAVGSGPRAVTPPGRVDTKPLEPAGTAQAAATAPAPAAATAAPTAAAPRDPDEDLNWLWPASGPVLNGFDDTRSKGVAIAGKAGDPVLATADGRVVYAGSGLRGYGNLVIIKHNNTFLSAYAHNRTLLVKEDQAVKRGQRIAEMGSSDAERVQLHFEIRRQGKPVDPARYLPPR